jgi:hypothetical protein
MIRLALTLTAAAAAVVVLAATAGGVPPPVVAHIAVTHLRPVAGHTFTGVTVVPVTQAGQPRTTIQNVTCPAQIQGVNLRARKQRFYEHGVGLVAITCSWHVPTSARGTFSTQVAVDTSSINLSNFKMSWRIKR